MDNQVSTRQANSLGSKVRSRLVLFFLLAMAAGVFGVFSRAKTEASLASWTRTQGVPTVAIIHPIESRATQTLNLPGKIEAWYSAPIYARVSGYVKMWYTDIGDHVKKGQVLAEIDTPDLDQQYAEAEGELAKAQANDALAEITARRWEALGSSSAVSQQDVDEKKGELNARNAEVAAARARMSKLAALEGFKRVLAPFDGVVTARNVDVGALVSATPSGMPELFKVADIHEMRIYVSVPQAFSGRIRTGMDGELVIPQLPNQKLQAKVATTSDSIAQSSLSLLVELRRNNKDGLLQPGSFGEVEFNLPPDSGVLTIPADTLVFRDSQPMVASIGVDGRVLLKPIVIDRDLGEEIEVSSGINTHDEIIKSPSDSIADGDVVRVAGASITNTQISAR